MADSMDLAQLREQEDRERHINNARAKVPVFPVFSVRSVMLRFRQLAAALFRACSAV